MSDLNVTSCGISIYLPCSRLEYTQLWHWGNYIRSNDHEESPMTFITSWNALKWTWIRPLLRTGGEGLDCTDPAQVDRDCFPASHPQTSTLIEKSMKYRWSPWWPPSHSSCPLHCSPSLLSACFSDSIRIACRRRVGMRMLHCTQGISGMVQWAWSVSPVGQCVSVCGSGVLAWILCLHCNFQPSWPGEEREKNFPHLGTISVLALGCGFIHIKRSTMVARSSYGVQECDEARSGKPLNIWLKILTAFRWHCSGWHIRILEENADGFLLQTSIKGHTFLWLQSSHYVWAYWDIILRFPGWMIIYNDELDPLSFNV